MHQRAVGVLLVGFLALTLATVSCSVSGLVSRVPQAVEVPTRTPRPTWTPRPDAVRVATPTLDATRFPGVVLPTPVPPTPQLFVPGAVPTIFLPQPGIGGPAVQTVVVIIVTATPIPSPTLTSAPGTRVRPTATPTPAPPTATPTITPTPLPPVLVEVTVDQANVRQGPGLSYPVITQLDQGTQITVIGRNAAGDWWKVCCVNGADVWIAASVTAVKGPLWTVPEVSNIPPPPPPPAPTATPAPTPTFAWPFRLETAPKEYPLGQNYFRVDAVIYNGATPLWGYKLRVRKYSTGQEWLSGGSSSYWDWTIIQWPDDGKSVNPTLDCPSPRTGLQCQRSNLKWDSNGVGVPLGDDVWEVTVTDRLGNPQSAPVRFYTSVANSKWYYVVFTSR